MSLDGKQFHNVFRLVLDLLKSSNLFFELTYFFFCLCASYLVLERFSNTFNVMMIMHRNEYFSFLKFELLFKLISFNKLSITQFEYKLLIASMPYDRFFLSKPFKSEWRF